MIQLGKILDTAVGKIGSGRGAIKGIFTDKDMLDDYASFRAATNYAEMNASQKRTVDELFDTRVKDLEAEGWWDAYKWDPKSKDVQDLRGAAPTSKGKIDPASTLRIKQSAARQLKAGASNTEISNLAMKIAIEEGYTF